MVFIQQRLDYFSRLSRTPTYMYNGWDESVRNAYRLVVMDCDLGLCFLRTVTQAACGPSYADSAPYQTAYNFSKLSLGMSMHGCLYCVSLCCHVMDWRSAQGVSRLLSNDC
ncbi:hypothetical protein GOODEAATRI_013348 [Goodea atripinnis]|uniref:Uncharacterized protein n=1 Tax=Goodea atripinnis TaxID=208336 RepID=A0ABV0MJF7_9TELE